MAWSNRAALTQSQKEGNPLVLELDKFIPPASQLMENTSYWSEKEEAVQDLEGDDCTQIWEKPLAFTQSVTTTGIASQRQTQ